MEWAYGVTTVPSRVKDGLLIRTLSSLYKAGFEDPRLFVDGKIAIAMVYNRFMLQVTMHTPKIGAYGNWIVSLLELYMRNPKADMYVMFQDDILAAKNLREYLESCTYPIKGYWNLINYPTNVKKAPSKEYVGWYPSDQMGRGGQGLAFTQEALRVLFSHKLIFVHPHEYNGPRSLDGAVSRIFKDRGWKEYVHSPGLMGHTGQGCSIIGKRLQPNIEFVENRDAASLFNKTQYHE